MLSSLPTARTLALDFAAPDRLWLLAAAGALAVAYVVMQIRRRRDAAKFADPALLPLLVSGKAISRPKFVIHIFKIETEAVFPFASDKIRARKLKF